MKKRQKKNKATVNKSEDIGQFRWILSSLVVRGGGGLGRGEGFPIVILPK